eukprot:COSAG03_NODE_24833_length_269_cov_1.152941_1_plen_42_part_01
MSSMYVEYVCICAIYGVRSRYVFATAGEGWRCAGCREAEAER